MKRILCLVFTLGLAALPISASANHSWGNYHWARTNNPFVLKVGDNLTSAWDPYLATTATNWSQSIVLDMNVVSGRANPKNCRPTSGRVEVCNSIYGKTGWLGIAQVWVNGDHITQGTTKLNDTYFNTPTYNQLAWKNLVMCQEVGHTLGLDHQDEDFNNPPLGTCMDYTNDPTPNQFPNAHDYQELETIYAHLDTFTTVDQTVARIVQNNLDNRSDWGKQLKNNGKTAVFERDFGHNSKAFTFVIWTQN